MRKLGHISSYKQYYSYGKKADLSRFCAGACFESIILIGTWICGAFATFFKAQKIPPEATKND